MCRDPATGVELEPAVGEVADVCAGLIGAGGVCVRRRAPLLFDELLKLDLRLIPPPPPPPRAKAGVSVETKNIAANSAELAMSFDVWIIGVSPCLLIVCNQALTFRAISRRSPRDSWVGGPDPSLDPVASFAADLPQTIGELFQLLLVTDREPLKSAGRGVRGASGRAGEIHAGSEHSRRGPPSREGVVDGLAYFRARSVELPAASLPLPW
jgi:hypothetical protein